MLVLGLDTATPACVVALAEVTDGQVRERTSSHVVDARRHGELLAPMIQQALRDAGAAAADLEAIVVGLGPGPYTSLRVGVVTAAALADALSIPAYGVCSLDGIGPLGPAVTTVATDARRREVYYARYQGGKRIAGPEVAKPAAVAAELAPGERVVGGGGELYADVFGAAYDASGSQYPRGLALITHALRLLGGAARPLEPLYLRRPDATPRPAGARS